MTDYGMNFNASCVVRGDGYTSVGVKMEDTEGLDIDVSFDGEDMEEVVQKVVQNTANQLISHAVSHDEEPEPEPKPTTRSRVINLMDIPMTHPPRTKKEDFEDLNQLWQEFWGQPHPQNVNDEIDTDEEIEPEFPEENNIDEVDVAEQREFPKDLYVSDEDYDWLCQYLNGDEDEESYGGFDSWEDERASLLNDLEKLSDRVDQLEKENSDIRSFWGDREQKRKAASAKIDSLLSDYFKGIYN